MLFKKPLGMLARSVSDNGNDMFFETSIHIHFAQNGFKISVGGEDLIASDLEEVIELIRERGGKLIEKLKKADK